MARDARVCVVVVSWNACSYLAASLTSLETQEPHELIVVDNGSTDGSVALVRSMARAKLLELSNPGFGAANNAAAESAESDYLLLLNSDAELRPRAINALAEFLDRHPDVAIVGPRLVRPDGTLQRSAGRRPSIATEALNKTMLHRIWHYQTLGRFDFSEVRFVDWVSGACMMVRASAFRHVGGFDPGYFMFYEDLDLCERIRREGWSIAFVPDAEALHHGGKSQAQVKGSMLIASQHSVERFFSLHRRPLDCSLLRGLTALEAVLRSVVWFPLLLLPGRRAQAQERLGAYARLARTAFRSSR